MTRPVSWLSLDCNAPCHQLGTLPEELYKHLVQRKSAWFDFPALQPLAPWLEPLDPCDLGLSPIFIHLLKNKIDPTTWQLCARSRHTEINKTWSLMLKSMYYSLLLISFSSVPVWVSEISFSSPPTPGLSLFFILGPSTLAGWWPDSPVWLWSP